MKKFLILDEYEFSPSNIVTFSKVIEAEDPVQAMLYFPPADLGFDDPSDIDPLEKKLAMAHRKGECSMATVGVYELTTGVNEIEKFVKASDPTVEKG